MNKLKVKSLLPAAFISVSTCFMLCIYAPLELYLGNQHEFWFGLKYMMPFVCGLFIISAVLSFAVFLLLYSLNEKLYTAAVLVAFAAFICLYFEGNFLAGNLPPLDGTQVDFSAYPMERLKFSILWLTVAVIILVLCKIFGTTKLAIFAGYISLGVFGMLAITAVTLCLTTRLDESASYNLAFTETEKYTMSEDTNLVILSLDQASAEAFEWAITEYPEFSEAFSDFTYFDNTSGAYTYTSRSLPFLLTGEWFENEKPFQSFLNYSFGDSPLMNRLWDENYSVGIYLPDYRLSADMYEGRTVNGIRENATARSPLLMAKMLIKMAGLKYAPWDLKYFSYDIPSLNKHLRYVDGGEQIYDFSSEAFYSQPSSNNPIMVSGGRSFKIIHFEGGHTPYDFNKSMETVEDGTYKEKVASALTITSLYLQRLKESEVYDNTALIITADHGFGDEDTDEFFYYPNRRFHPILLAKGIGESHEKMQKDHAPISYVDFQEAYMRLLDRKSSSEIFDWKEGDARERRCLLYYYTEENTMDEWIITGDAGDIDAMHKTGKQYVYSGSVD